MYASLRIIGMITDMGLVCGTHGKKRNAHGVLIGKSEGKRSLLRRRRGCNELKRIFGKWGGIVWSGLSWPRTETGCGFFCRFKERFKRTFDFF